jgi:hypothetical protein
MLRKRKYGEECDGRGSELGRRPEALLSINEDRDGSVLYPNSRVGPEHESEYEWKQNEGGRRTLGISSILVPLCLFCYVLTIK